MKIEDRGFEGNQQDDGSVVCTRTPGEGEIPYLQDQITFNSIESFLEWVWSF